MCVVSADHRTDGRRERPIYDLREKAMLANQHGIQLKCFEDLPANEFLGRIRFDSGDASRG